MKTILRASAAVLSVLGAVVVFMVIKHKPLPTIGVVSSLFGGHGTGFLVEYENELKVLTAAHVCNAGILPIKTFAVGDKEVGGVVTHINNAADICLISSAEFEGNAASWGEAVIDSRVTSLGFPGHLQAFVIIEAPVLDLKEESHAPHVTNLSTAVVGAAIQPGTSGGPILNSENRVVGVVLASSNEGGVSLVARSGAILKVLQEKLWD